MRFEFKPSFERSLKSFSPSEITKIKEASGQLIDVLSLDRQMHQGLGLKRLREDFWESRSGIKARILFRWKGDFIEFILAGNHDDIKRFLKSS